MLLKKFIFIEINLGIIIYFCVVILKENIEFFFFIVLVYIENVFYLKLIFLVNLSVKNIYMFCMKFLFV